MNPTHDNDDYAPEETATGAVEHTAVDGLPRPGDGSSGPSSRGWPAAGACRRIALVIFGLALTMHLSISVLVLSLGFGLRFTVIISELIALLGLSLWVSFRMGLPPSESLLLRQAGPVHLLFALFAALPLQVFGGAMQYLILQSWADDGAMREMLERSYQELMRTETAFDVVVLFFTGVLLAAVCEEVLFRGLLLQLLARHSGWGSAIFLGAVLFSAFHLDPIGFLPRLPIGLFLGLLVWRSGSLYPAVLAHGTFNFVGLFLVPQAGEQPTFESVFEMGLWAGFIFCAILVLYLLVTRATPPPIGKLLEDGG
jgi:membrane protease YdiL (CAAX protease family)